MAGMRRLIAVLACIIILVSLVWGVAILAADVAPPTVKDPELSCGGVLGSLEGKPNYGGELPYPHDWIDQCKTAANEKARWIVVPAIAGPMALLYLIGSFVAVVRRAKAEGRSTGALSS
jgi:hypothetical protein